MGSPRPMIGALSRLGAMEAGELPQNVATAGINGRPGWMSLFSSHPPLKRVSQPSPLPAKPYLCNP